MIGLRRDMYLFFGLSLLIFGARTVMGERWAAEAAVQLSGLIVICLFFVLMRDAIKRRKTRRGSERK